MTYHIFQHPKRITKKKAYSCYYMPFCIFKPYFNEYGKIAIWDFLIV